MTTLQAIKDIVTIIAASIASWVAITGLNTWKKQLKGKTDYELARRYLRSIYKIRDAIKYVRNPFISIDEIFSALKESGMALEDYADRQKSNRAVYALRWKKVVAAGSDISVELLEAQVSWGVEAINIQKDLDVCYRELFASLKLFLEGHELKGQRDIIYDMGDEDEFNKKMTQAIQRIEDYLRPHLK